MDDSYREAQRRVEQKKQFYKELGSFVSTSLLLIFINVFTSPGYLWFLWAVVPWGLTILIRGIKVGLSSKTSNWERDEMKKELRALGKNPNDYLEDRLELDDLRQKSRLYDDFNDIYKDSDLV